MNKTMQAMMKPIVATKDNSRGMKRLLQEEHVLNWMRGIEYSVCAADVADDCHDIPHMDMYWWGTTDSRSVSQILKRLEKKGHVISTLYGNHRYYSIPATPDELMKTLLKGGEQ